MFKFEQVQTNKHSKSNFLRQKNLRFFICTNLNIKPLQFISETHSKSSNTESKTVDFFPNKKTGFLTRMLNLTRCGFLVHLQNLKLTEIIAEFFSFRNITQPELIGLQKNCN